MKKTWKKLLAAGLTAMLIVSVPGSMVLADEMKEEAALSVQEDSEQVIEAEAEDPVSSDEVAPDIDEVSPVDEESIVGAGKITVGDGVTATFDEKTGAVEFFSSGGVLKAEWLGKSGFRATAIKSIKVASGMLYLAEDSSSMFEGLSSLTSIDLRGFNTSHVDVMSCMFKGCSSLKSIDVSVFNTSHVETMDSMFEGCRSLTSLDLRSFNTSKVRDMSAMFCGCSKLTSIDLSSFDTSKTWNMTSLFEDCSSLKSLNVKNFNTSSLTDMDAMFGGCSGLGELDLSSFDLSRVLKYDYAFIDCTGLDTLRTPKNNKKRIELPFTMYDKSAKAYGALPALTKSITLSKGKPVTKNFSDVQDPTNPYYKAIYWAADAGITNGYSDGTFGINRSCTRGEMIMFLWRYAGKPAPKKVSKSPFKDVSTSHNFYRAILWASQKGITKGYSDGTFGINRAVSRGECMMFLWRIKGKPAPKAVSASPFKDVPTTHTFYKAILWGYQNKITKGYTSGAKKGAFGIYDDCTRGQIVTFLYRAK